MPRQLSRSPPAPRSAWLLPVLAIMLLAGPACADVPGSLAAPGATLDEVLGIARRLSPELAARALDTEAAQARVEIAGSLADPTPQGRGSQQEVYKAEVENILSSGDHAGEKRRASCGALPHPPVCCPDCLFETIDPPGRPIPGSKP